MKLIATANFKPLSVTRALRPGEPFEVATAIGRQMVQNGLAATPKRARDIALDAARARALPFRESR